MIQCPECKQSMSGEADRCPHCGFANKGMIRALNARATLASVSTGRDGKRNAVPALLLVLAALIAIPIALATCSAYQAPSAAEKTSR